MFLTAGPNVSLHCIMWGKASHLLARCRFGEVDEVVGMVDYPLEASNCETLAHSLLRFRSGLSASLYCHFNRIPMTTLPFFQIFGNKVKHTHIQKYHVNKGQFESTLLF